MLPLELVELLQPVVYYLADLGIARNRPERHTMAI
jgi:hypothetical protein